MNVFLGSTANNLHVQQIGLGLHEAGRLDVFATPSVDGKLAPPLSLLRALLPRISPKIDAQLRRRRPVGIPVEKLRETPLWDSLRLASGKAGFPDTWSDSIWEHQEHAFARWCGRRIHKTRPSLFLGMEHGALEALQAARDVGTVGALMFTSLHHRFRERWLAPEYERFPELLGAQARIIRTRDRPRDQRRDAELALASFVHANSSVTERSLVEAGVPRERILTLPLGAPPVDAHALDRVPGQSPAVVLFVGNVAVHKGAHHLLEAWNLLRVSKGARLEFCGASLLPERCMPQGDASVIFHGHLPPDHVRQAMRTASVLVLPSLCDGFGMVVTEAMAQGLPVVCSANAGASQLVREGVNGFVVAPADPRALAEKIDWCLAHPRELAEMGRAAAETVRGWTWRDFRREFIAGLDRMSAKS